MTTNWLELMGDDSDLSMTCLDDDLSRQTDPELDHSRQGVNLLFKKQIKIISEDSQSRKRTLNEMNSTDADDTLRAMSKLPPKAKQRTDDEGHWAHRKDGGGNENAGGKIGFSQFLKWAPKGSQANSRAVLGARPRTNNNRANTLRTHSANANVAPLTAMVTCAPGKTRSRKLSRGRRSRKTSPRKTPTPTPAQTPSETPTQTQTPTQSTKDVKQDMAAIATPTRATVKTAATTKNTQRAEKEQKKEKDNEDEKEEETEKKDVEDEEEEEDVDMKEAEQMGPNGNVIGNAVCAEAMIRPDHNDNDADDEDEDDEDNEVEAPQQTEEIKKAEKAEKVEEDEKEEAEDEEEEDEDEDEDDDLTPADRSASVSVGRRSRRVTPILHNVVFNTDLMHNKVPILRKSEEREAVKAVMGPVFLNADEYDELYPKEGRRDSHSHSHSNSKQAQQSKEKENEEGEDEKEAKAQPASESKQQQQPQQPPQQQQAIQAKSAPSLKHKGRAPTKSSQSSTPNVQQPQKQKQKKKPQRQGPLSWASKLFGRGGGGTERSEQQMAMEESNARRIMLSRESSVRSSDVKSVHSEQTADSAQSGESQQSKGSHVGMGMGMGMSLGMGVSIGRASTSISRVGSPKSVGSRSSSVSVVCAPSEGATKWRQKQIQYGTNTEGYQNFIAQFPNKDAMFRLRHEFVETPDPKEKIGKKRWVGKYQKWRKFLHKFDTNPTPTPTPTQTPSQTPTPTQTQIMAQTREGEEDL